jgi:hypothetical protein
MYYVFSEDNSHMAKFGKSLELQLLLNQKFSCDVKPLKKFTFDMCEGSGITERHTVLFYTRSNLAVAEMSFLA